MPYYRQPTPVYEDQMPTYVKKYYDKTLPITPDYPQRGEFGDWIVTLSEDGAQTMALAKEGFKAGGKYPVALIEEAFGKYLVHPVMTAEQATVYLKAVGETAAAMEAEAARIGMTLGDIAKMAKRPDIYEQLVAEGVHNNIFTGGFEHLIEINLKIKNPSTGALKLAGHHFDPGGVLQANNIVQYKNVRDMGGGMKQVDLFHHGVLKKGKTVFPDNTPDKLYSLITQSFEKIGKINYTDNILFVQGEVGSVEIVTKIKKSGSLVTSYPWD